MKTIDTPTSTHTADAVVIGAGPAGLMAAETMTLAGLAVDVYDAMPSVARKLLIAGVGGLNLTHSEPIEAFVSRYRSRSVEVGSWLAQFDADGVRAWARGLGVETFVGSSDRVFPTDMKAAPLLRAWLRRLKHSGATIHLRHRWTGWDDEGKLRFQTSDGPFTRPWRSLVLALGGGSWPHLGSDGQWVHTLSDQHIPIHSLQASNCGFDVAWSAHFRSRFSGAAVKPVRASLEPDVAKSGLQGEFVISEHGVEGSLIYALSADLRETLLRNGKAELYLDLVPGRDLPRLQADLARPRGRRSLSEHLRRQVGVDGVKAGLLYECAPRTLLQDSDGIAHLLKSLPVQLQRTRPIEEAISSAGGIRLEALNASLMLKRMPGVFCAGEMLDWDAPTGGYLLTACFASGRVAGAAAIHWLQFPHSRN